MDVKVDIDAAAVNKMVADAILHSVLGEQVKELVATEVQRHTSSYDGPLRAIVSSEISRLVMDHIHQHYAEQIRAWVAEKVTEEFTSDLFSRMWDAFERKYR